MSVRDIIPQGLLGIQFIGRVTVGGGNLSDVIVGDVAVVFAVHVCHRSHGWMCVTTSEMRDYMEIATRCSNAWYRRERMV